MRRELAATLGKAISRHATFRWMEAVPERECGARGWEAGPGTYIDVNAIADAVLALFEQVGWECPSYDVLHATFGEHHEDCAALHAPVYRLSPKDPR
jgi:hypothetical protein